MEKKNTKLEVVFILDRSGSMSGLEADTIGAFNANLKQQKESGADIVWSTVLFDNRHEVVHDRVPIDKVGEMNSDIYYVRGSTALLDAVGRAIHHIGNVHKYARPEDVPGRTLFIITTDGMENSSREYSYNKVKHMITHEQEKYGWEFLFLGANIDAANVGERIGIRRERSARFHSDGRGIRRNYAVLGEAIARMSRDEDLEDDVLERIREDYRSR